MNEVSCRTLAPILHALDVRGIPRTRLIEGLDTDLDALERASNRIDWELYAAIVARLEGLVGTEALVEIGATSPDFPAMRPLVALLGAITRPAHIYHVMVKVVGPSMFHNMHTQLENLGPGRIRVVFTIPREYRDVPQLYHICRGGLQINPTLCGYPPADVRMELTDRRAVYDVRIHAPEPTYFGRVRAWVRGLWRARAGLDEMELQRRELEASFEALRTAERRIRRQRALLRRARFARRRAEAAQARAEEDFHRAQKLEGIGLLAGGVAHDFNNLLAGILGNTELALRELPAEAPARLRIERIRLGATRATDLTEQLLTYAGRRPPASREVDLSELVREMHELLRTTVPRSTVLHEALSPDLPAVAADATQIRQVVMNLLTNAASAVESNGGEVTLATHVVHADAARLSRACLAPERPAEEYVCVEISDTGVGMDAATRERIFDPFFTTRAHGRGLGLAAVLGIVRGHRGAIEVESEPGRGSCFRVLLPSLGCAPAQADAEPPQEVWRGAGTVLFADDEADLRMAITGLLEAEGFTVVGARDGTEAVALARQLGDTVDIYLVDRTMPGQTGEEVFRAVRAMRPDARVVLCSGFHDERALEAMFAEGLTATLSKPFGTRELVATLRRALEGSPEPALAQASDR